MTTGLLLTAFGLGLRHGIDWDHIAAITDLTSSAKRRSRGLLLSTLYALGHAAVVAVLGAALLLAGVTIPTWLDAWMGRVVGLTLIALGIVVLTDLIKRGADARLRSRWLLVLKGAFAGFRRVRDLVGARAVEVSHTHSHDRDAGSHDHAP